MSERTPMRHAQTALAGLALVLPSRVRRSRRTRMDSRPTAVPQLWRRRRRLSSRVNAKNRAGGYAGSVRFIAGWNRGTLAWEAVTFDPALAPDEVDPALNPDEDAYQILSPESHESAFESLWSDICR
jgi:hypothetical protein